MNKEVRFKEEAYRFLKMYYSYLYNIYTIYSPQA